MFEQINICFKIKLFIIFVSLPEQQQGGNIKIDCTVTVLNFPLLCKSYVEPWYIRQMRKKEKKYYYQTVLVTIILKMLVS